MPSIAAPIPAPANREPGPAATSDGKLYVLPYAYLGAAINSGNIVSELVSTKRFSRSFSAFDVVIRVRFCGIQSTNDQKKRRRPRIAKESVVQLAYPCA